MTTTTSIRQELENHWGAAPNGSCHCGCRSSSKSIFASSGGHDSKFAAKLLRELRGNPEVDAAIKRLAGRYQDKPCEGSQKESTIIPTHRCTCGIEVAEASSLCPEPDCPFR